MIPMISTAKLSHADSKAKYPNEPKEPEADEFAALLNGLSLVIPPPVVKPPASKQMENIRESPNSPLNKEIFADGATQPLPQFDGAIELPKDFAQTLPKSFSVGDFQPMPQKAFSPEQLIPENEKSGELNKNSRYDGDLFTQVEDFQIESNQPEFGKSESKIAANLLLKENPANAEKAPSSNKLPDLFREVSSFMGTTDFGAKNISAVAQTIQPASVEPGNVAAQIESQVLQMAILAQKTGKPQLLKMRLNPAELGGIEIKIEKNSSGKLNAHFQTEKEETRKILSETITQLKDSLQDSGWQVEHVEVSCGSNSFAGNEARENSSQAHKNAAQNSFAQTANSDGSANTKEDLNSEKSNRLLSVRA